MCVYNNKYIVSAYIHTWTHIFIYTRTYIHTRTHKQRILFLRIILTPRGSSWASMTLVILFTLYDPTKESRRYRRTARRIRASVVVQREILCHSQMPRNSRISFFFFYSVPFYNLVYKSCVFFFYRLILPLRSSLYRERRRGYERNYTGSSRIFGLGNETLTEDPWISRWNSPESHLEKNRGSQKKRKYSILFRVL